MADAQVGKLRVSRLAPLHAAVPSRGNGPVRTDRFEIAALLGSGAMGQVFAAFDYEIQEEIALKVVRPELCGNAEMMNRFRRELKYSRRISHRNVCGMRELFRGEWSDGGPLLFLTMELLRGQTLDEKFAESGRADEATVLRIADQIMAGLEAVHRAGLVEFLRIRDFLREVEHVS